MLCDGHKDVQVGKYVVTFCQRRCLLPKLFPPPPPLFLQPELPRNYPSRRDSAWVGGGDCVTAFGVGEGCHRSVITGCPPGDRSR